MTDYTPEALEALSKKATQGEWGISAYYTGTGPDEKCCGLLEVDDFPNGIIDEEGATAESLSPNLEFIIALVNLYRTGHLVLIDDQAVERVARQFKRSHRDSCYPDCTKGEAQIAAEGIIIALRTKP